MHVNAGQSNDSENLTQSELRKSKIAYNILLQALIDDLQLTKNEFTHWLTSPLQLENLLDFVCIYIKLCYIDKIMNKINPLDIPEIYKTDDDDDQDYMNYFDDYSYSPDGGTEEDDTYEQNLDDSLDDYEDDDF
jgi:hypothetical protein